MQELKGVKIIQIIPANGWGAVYADEPKGMPLNAVVCFALVERTKDGVTWQEVRPMGVDGKTIEFIDNASNFERVLYDPSRV